MRLAALNTRKRLLALASCDLIVHGPPRPHAVFKDLLAVVIKCLNDRNPHIRAAAVRCLPPIAEPSSISRLIRLLEKDKDLNVRYAILQAFIAFDGEVAAAAAAAVPLLARMVVRDYDKHYENATTFGEEAADALSSIGKPAVPALASIIADKKLKKAIRLTALRALGRMSADVRESITAPILCQALLTDPDEYVRYNAATILGRMKSAEDCVLVALLIATVDKSPWVRMEAAMSMCHFNPQNPIVLAIIQPHLEDKDAEVRRSACSRLGQIGAPRANPAIPKLINRVIDAVSDVRLEAINTLLIMAEQKANIRAAIPFLTITAILDPNATIRHAARQCLNAAKR